MASGNLSPRIRMELVFRKENPGKIPFVIWNNKIPDDKFAKQMLDAGACIVVKSEVYKTGFKSIDKEEYVWISDSGHKMKQIKYRTAAGDIEETCLISTGSKTPSTFLFMSPDDYDPVIAMIEDYTYIPCYSRFIKDDRIYGEQGIARPATEKSPFFEIMYEIMGIMNFAVEWNENRNRVLELYESLLKARIKRLQIVAESPARYCIVDGNIEMSIVGMARLEQFYIPAIQKACEMLNPKGIITGLHLDGNNGRLLNSVSKLAVGMIESFTPPPDCDITLEEGLRAWPDKAFMVNFPSSLHFLGEEEVKRNAPAILKQGKSSGRVMMGIMEDVPHNDFLPGLAYLVADEG